MELLKAHRADSGGVSPSVVVSVPGVTRYFGLFAEIYSGSALSSVNDAALYVALSKRTDGLIFCSNCATGEHRKMTLSAVKNKKEDKWCNYIKGTAEVVLPLIKNFSGVSITLDGPILQASTDIVKSAITIGTLYGLNKLYKLGFDLQDLKQKAYYVFNTFCSETIPYVNLFTMLYSKQNNFLLTDIEKSEYKLIEDSFRKTDYGIFVVNSKIPVLSFREDIEAISEELDAAMTDFTSVSKKSTFRTTDDVSFKVVSENLKSDNRLLCSYLYDEYRNTLQIQKIIEERNTLLFGKSMSRVQKGIREKLELICPETDWLAKRANELASCVGSCMVSCGMGGFVSFMANQSESDVYFERLQEYERIFGFKAKLEQISLSNKLQLIDANNPCLQN